VNSVLFWGVKKLKNFKAKGRPETGRKGLFLLVKGGQVEAAEDGSEVVLGADMDDALNVVEVEGVHSGELSVKANSQMQIRTRMVP